MKLRLSLIVLFLASRLAIGVPSAMAYDHSNYAGHTTCLNIFPCDGDYDSSCHWTIYGRVDNRNVLFGPYHCFGSSTGQVQSGGPIYNRDGVRLGVVAYPQTSQIAADMGWMWLDAGQVPFDKNEIPINGGSWSISQKYPNSTLTCANLLQGASGPLGTHTMKASYWDGVYQGPFSGTINSTGSAGDGSGHCVINTSVPFFSGTRHIPSGAPWLDASIGGSGFLGGTTDCDPSHPSCGIGATMRFNSWRQAILDLNAYWQNHGTATGAWFCANDSCT